MFKGPERKKRNRFFWIVVIIIFLGHLFSVTIPVLLNWEYFTLERMTYLTTNYAILWLVVLLFYLIYKMSDFFPEKKKHER